MHGPSLFANSPTIGRVVLVRGHNSNGSDVHPAIVTRAWSDRCVNLTIFGDFAAPTFAGSVEFRQTEADALAFLANNPTALVAHWPPRN